MKKFIILFTLSICFHLTAQEGLIRGTVIDDKTGETLIGVAVYLKGTTTGSVTDFDGKFEINTKGGTYDVVASFMSFQSVIIEGVNVQPDDVTLISLIRMKEDIQQLDDVVIQAEIINTTETALLTVKRKSANLLDGITADSFKKIGDSDVAGAIKRVTGISIEGGKYVYVRGLGDRYSKTMLNSVDIPGLDPDHNSLQIDIFPTNLIDNIIVLKSATADIPADFTGGIVDIITKDFPDEKILDVSLGVGFNPNVHLNKSFLQHEGSSTDGLGFDDGSRALPTQAKATLIPSPLNRTPSEEVNNFLSQFSPQLGASQKTSFLDYSMGFSLGNQIRLKNKNKLGYIFNMTYKNDKEHYSDVIFGEYQRPSGSENYELVPANIITGAFSKQNVLLGTLSGLAYKTATSKYKLTLMHLQNGESKAGQFDIYDNGNAVGKSGFDAKSDYLEYSQRGLSNALLHGKHYYENWNIDWKLSTTLSSLSDPDIRKTAFTETLQGEYEFNAGAGGNPSRTWRSLKEWNQVSKIDFTYEYLLGHIQSKLKFGLYHVYKSRSYEISNFNITSFGNWPEFSGDPNEVLVPENLYPNGTIYYQSLNSNPNSNAYTANINNAAAYVSTEIDLFERLKTIVGVRAESFIQRHTGRDENFTNSNGHQGNSLNNAKVLSSFKLFPSLNLVYNIQEKQNLRFSYSSTIARPSFKELSFAQILDPLSNRRFNGGLFQYPNWDGKLGQTSINNFDLRWEKFLKLNEIISLSAFYKTFEDPIELVRMPVAQTNVEIQPRNVGDGTIFGAELELRKNLSFLGQRLENLSINGNVTYVKSKIAMTDLEYATRKNYEKSGQTISKKRAMAGQAPYVINAGLVYESVQKNFNAGFFYNVKGSTLIIVGGGLYSDVFSEPFHSLNFNFNKTFGPNERLSFNFKVSNILNDLSEEFYNSFGAQNQHYSKQNPGVAFGLGASYSFK